MVCKYLNAIELEDKTKGQEKIYDIKKLKESQNLEDEICRGIIKKHILNGLKSPNFYYVNSYVNFVSDQLYRLEESIFF